MMGSAAATALSRAALYGRSGGCRMDPVPVGLLLAVAGGIGTESGEQSWSELGALIRRSGRAEETGVRFLEILRDHPADREAAARLAAVLEVRAALDSGFGAELSAWRTQAMHRHAAGGDVHSTISGGDFSGPVIMGRDITGITFTTIAVPTPVVPVAESQLQDLAAAVGVQWRREAHLRSLNAPEPIRIRWRITTRDVMGHPDMVFGRDKDRSPVHTPREGNLDEIVAFFQSIPSSQLVVIGRPGAGKTALQILLTLGLLDARSDDGKVPVLIPLTDWNPVREDLTTWLVGRLTRDYDSGRTSTRAKSRAFRSLVEEKRLILMLDGLDEMPSDRHPPAIAGIDSHIADGWPLVLTCRTAAYERAVMESNEFLKRAVVVEIEPVDVRDTITYLTHASRPGDERWKPIFEELGKKPGSPLAQTLTMPLMIWLMRTVYHAPTTDPAKLLDHHVFTEKEAVEDHLLDGFLPAIYDDSRRHHDPARKNYSLHDANKWLTFLADHLQRRRSRDLDWWQLATELSFKEHLLLGTAFGVVAGLLGGLLFSISNPLLFSLYVTFVVGFPMGLAVGYVGPPDGISRIQIGFGSSDRRKSRIVVGLAAGTITGLGLGVSSRLQYGLVIIGLGLLVGVFIALLDVSDPVHAKDPRTTLRHDTMALLGLAAAGFMTGLVGAFFVILAGVRLPAWLGGCLGGILGGGFAGGTILRLRGCILGGTLMGALGALGGSFSSTPIVGSAGTAGSGIVFALSYALATGLAETASGWFAVTRWRLRSRGRLPWRLMDFLDDAHRRGVLRQVGASYQFSHASLQDRLTSGGDDLADHGDDGF